MHGLHARQGKRSHAEDYHAEDGSQIAARGHWLARSRAVLRHVAKSLVGRGPCTSKLWARGRNARMHALRFESTAVHPRIVVRDRLIIISVRIDMEHLLLLWASLLL